MVHVWCSFADPDLFYRIRIRSNRPDPDPTKKCHKTRNKSKNLNILKKSLRNMKSLPVLFKINQFFKEGSGSLSRIRTNVVWIYNIGEWVVVTDLRLSRGLVLWIWVSQVGQALLFSTCFTMQDLQTEKTEHVAKYCGGCVCKNVCQLNLTFDTWL